MKSIENPSSVGIRNAADYSPFGVQLDGRTQSGTQYRYGYQGQEQDDEVKGKGNSVNYKYRMHDPRVGRFFVVDPLMRDYPGLSTYQFSGNVLLNAIEAEGLEPAYLFSDSEDNAGFKSPTFMVKMMYLKLYGNEFTKGLGNSYVKIDQTVHDDITGYESGAITLGKEIYFTSNYDNANAESWLKLYSHEVVHSQQFAEMFGTKFKSDKEYKNAVASWAALYITEAAAIWLGVNLAELQYPVSVDIDLHDEISIEKEANQYEDMFKDFFDSQQYTDNNGVVQNKVVDLLESGQKSYEAFTNAKTKESKEKHKKNFQKSYNELMDIIEDYKDSNSK